MRSSEDRFGAAARGRYASLLIAAMADVAEFPDGPSVTKVRISGREIRLYHIAHSRRHVRGPSNRVAEPRHLLVLEVGGDGLVDILALIHERMLRGRALRRLVRQVED